jgi:hypothetical protein
MKAGIDSACSWGVAGGYLVLPGYVHKETIWEEKKA